MALMTGLAGLKRSKDVPLRLWRGSALGHGTDRAVVLGVLTRMWSIGSGPVSLLLIASFFSLETQAYYYTFGSLLTLQVFVELGLGQAAQQFASHEWARLHFDDAGGVAGDRVALSRLASLSRLIGLWYAGAAVLFVGALSWGGGMFLSRPTDTDFPWWSAWMAACVATGLLLWLVPVWALLEACGQVVRVYEFRCAQVMCMSLATWVAIPLGAGLWTPAVASGVALVVALAFLWARHRRFLRSLLSVRSTVHVDWRKEIWPVQWRTALSWLGTYSVVTLPTPLVFWLQGPIAAGQMGMTWTLISAVWGVSSTWVATKSPRLGALVARREYAVLDRVSLQAGMASFVVAIVGALTLLAAVSLVYATHHPFAARLLPPYPTALFLTTVVLLQVTGTQQAYLRAHKREPFVALSIVCGLLTFAVAAALGARFGATGVAAGFLAVTALVMLPFGTLIWYRCRTAWHTLEGES